MTFNLGWTKCRISLETKLLRQIEDAEVGEGPGPSRRRDGGQVAHEVKVGGGRGLRRLLLWVLGDGRAEVAQGPGGGHVPRLSGSGHVSVSHCLSDRFRKRLTETRREEGNKT